MDIMLGCIQEGGEDAHRLARAYCDRSSENELEIQDWLP
jgi:hypothetical protein